MARVAVLDDYQGVALEMADWSALAPDCRVQVFRDHGPIVTPWRIDCGISIS
jgi:hypothetical protein